MGCEAMSAYSDEVIGKLGYSSEIMQDLIQRDYQTSQQKIEEQHLLKNNRVIKPQQEIKDVMGYTKSFTKGCLYLTVIKNVEYLIFSCGRFVIIKLVDERKSPLQGLLMHEDVVNSMDVHEKLCLVGLHGGKLVLWDLQFQTIKIQIVLPQISVSISSVGFTNKYIFITDTSQPNNFVYCYDIKTSKLKHCQKISSLEPTFRGLSLNEHYHVTVAADGVWFMRYSLTNNQIEVVKGMFGQFPKTSMTCLDQVNTDYIVSGGVDGYVYLWSIGSYQCVKALKCQQTEITTIRSLPSKLIVCGLNNKIKVHEFEIKKTSSNTSNPDQHQHVSSIVIDSYQKQSAIQCVALSLTTQGLYYCQSNQGLIFAKLIPSSQNHQTEKKVGIVQRDRSTFIKLHLTQQVYLHADFLYCVYPSSSNTIHLDIHRQENDSFLLIEEKYFVLKQKHQKLFDYSIHHEELAYVSENNQIRLQKSLSEVQAIDSQNHKQDALQNDLKIIDIPKAETISNINYLQNITKQPNQTYFTVSTNQNIYFYLRVSEYLFQQIQCLKYQKKIPEKVTINERQIVFDSLNKKWKWLQENEEDKQLQLKHDEKKAQIHCGRIKCISQNKRISISSESIIFWKE